MKSKAKAYSILLKEAKKRKKEASKGSELFPVRKILKGGFFVSN